MQLDKFEKYKEDKVQTQKKFKNAIKQKRKNFRFASKTKECQKLRI